ncbi:MAG: hypothetical protein K9J17_10515 [Flavobacteriales bacterium]|nr:hypothetical protein [Flavobacteriales bacterium]
MKRPHFSFLLISFFLTACTTPKWPMQTEYPSEVQTALQEFLPKLEVSPDDPALHDEGFDFNKEYCPQLSDPYWLIPSLDLPEGVNPQNSNNNVSITIFNHRLFLAFRTGPTHFASKKTGLYIISTSDGKAWRKEKEIFIGRDMREPFLVPIDGKLHFYTFGAGTKMTAFEPEFIDHFTTDGNGNWSEPEKVLNLGEVHWSMKNRNGSTFMTSYIGSHYELQGPSKVRMYFKQTDDGVNWKSMNDTGAVYFGGVSETAWEFDRDKNLWAVTRLEDGDNSGFGSHVAFAKADDYGNWEFPDTADTRCFMSPKMFRHGDDLYLIGRRQLGKKPFGKVKRTKKMSAQRKGNWVGYSLSPKTTALFKINKETRKVEWVMDLPGAGDTAFPSIIRLDKHRFLVANYTSPINHQKRDWLMGQLGKTKIYLQVISFAPCAN